MNEAVIVPNGIPAVSFARVVAIDVDSHGLWVMLPSSQVIGYPIKTLINGPADAFRVRQHPLPVPGTWGVIATPNQDLRASIWLGSVYNTTSDAITSHDPPIDLDAEMNYEAHISGHFELLDGAGNSYVQYADGSNTRSSSDNAIPYTFRHIRTPNGLRQQLQYIPADRNPVQPNPFYASFNHSSGSSLEIDPLGDIYANQVNGASQSFTASGVTIAIPYLQYVQVQQANIGSTIVGSSLTLTPSGSFAMVVPAGQNSTVTQVSGASIDIGDLGTVTIKTKQNQSLSLQVPTVSGSSGEGSQVNMNGDGTLSIIDTNTCTIQTDTSANVLVIPGNVTGTPGKVTLQNPTVTSVIQIDALGNITLSTLSGLSVIEIDVAGDITLTTASGVITMPAVLGPIVVAATNPGGGIHLTGPSNTIKANGNILG